MVEDFLVMEDLLDLRVDKDQQALMTPWTSETNSGANAPSDIRYICSREYI